MLLSQENRENDADDLREKMNNSRSALEERIIKEKQVTKKQLYPFSTLITEYNA